MNPCPKIAMPEAREEKRVSRPYDLPPRPESIIDLDFKRTSNDRINAFIGLGLAKNALGQTLMLKQKFSFACPALYHAKVRFELVDDETSTYHTKSH